MLALKARVRNGRLVLDEPTSLPEGSEVELVVHEPVGFEATDEQEDAVDEEELAQLNAALDQSIAEARAGHTIDAEEVLRELREQR